MFVCGEFSSIAKTRNTVLWPTTRPCDDHSRVFVVTVCSFCHILPDHSICNQHQHRSPSQENTKGEIFLLFACYFLFFCFAFGFSRVLAQSLKQQSLASLVVSPGRGHGQARASDPDRHQTDQLQHARVPQRGDALDVRTDPFYLGLSPSFIRVSATATATTFSISLSRARTRSHRH